MIAAIVLAAGVSRRLGRPKQHVVLAGQTLLQRTVKTARDAGLSPIILVGREVSEYSSFVSSPEIIIAINEAADEGIASSIRCGVAEASRFKPMGAVILTCDQPGLQARHLRGLIEEPQRMTGSAYGQSIGVPAYFPTEFFSSLLQLRGDTGARALLKSARAIRAEELNLDIDTEHDLELARRLLEMPPS